MIEYNVNQRVSRDNTVIKTTAIINFEPDLIGVVLL